MKKAERYLNTALVEKQRGGDGGGGIDLTEQGGKRVKAYGKFRGDVEEAVEKAYKKYIEELVN